MFLNIFQASKDSAVGNRVVNIYRNICVYEFDLSVSKNIDTIYPIIYDILKEELLKNVYSIYVDPYSDREENISAQSLENYIYCIRLYELLNSKIDKHLFENCEVVITTKIGYDDYGSKSTDKLNYKYFNKTFTISKI